MIDLIKGIFSSGNAIEKIATEWIETGKEKAEAATIMVKALDPNGMMRRELSRKVAGMYSLYLMTALLLLTIEFIAVMFGWDIDFTQLDKTTTKVTELFTPITTLFGLIVSASFGVNYTNVKQNK